MDSSWSLLYKNTYAQIFKFNLSSDLIEFQEYLKDSPKFLLIWPLFIIILINSWLNLKICEFGIDFDQNLYIFNDHVNSSSHCPQNLRRLTQGIRCNKILNQGNVNIEGVIDDFPHASILTWVANNMHI